MTHACDVKPWNEVIRRAKTVARDPQRGHYNSPVSESDLMDLTTFLRGGSRSRRDIARQFPHLYEEQIKAALRATKAVKTGNTSNVRYSL